MQQRKLGQSDLLVSALGLGCMGMSEFYGSHNEAESLTTLRRAVELGVTFWDTADIYGPFTNEQLLAKVLPEVRSDITLATKFGIERTPDGGIVGLNSSPEYVRRACDASLQRLGVEQIDLYYQHRVDPRVPIEETVGAMSELVTAGKVRYLGLSEASADTLKRACGVHPITAVQSEYSLWSRDIEAEVIPACVELGVSLVAYSPLGRGFLSGAISSIDDLDADDWRRHNPRFQGENFDRNLELVQTVRDMAAARECTASQFALAWLLAQGEHVVPIPGTRNANRLAENAKAADLALSPDELAEINSIFPLDVAAGTRYPESGMALVNA